MRRSMVACLRAITVAPAGAEEITFEQTREARTPLTAEAHGAEGGETVSLKQI